MSKIVILTAHSQVIILISQWIYLIYDVILKKIPIKKKDRPDNASALFKGMEEEALTMGTFEANALVLSTCGAAQAIVKKRPFCRSGCRLISDRFGFWEGGQTVSSHGMVS